MPIKMSDHHPIEPSEHPDSARPSVGEADQDAMASIEMVSEGAPVFPQEEVASDVSGTTRPLTEEDVLDWI